MGYPPISRIAVAPDPVASGTTFDVTEDTGVRFPAVPFSALVWPQGETPVVGVNAENIVVTARSRDTFTVTRGDSPIDIGTGMMISANATPVYEVGDDLTISHDFGSHDPPYILVLRSPSGEVGAYGSATGVQDDGAGFAYFNFDLSRAGLWYFRWESASEQGADEDFFVAFSPARG